MSLPLLVAFTPSSPRSLANPSLAEVLRAAEASLRLRIAKIPGIHVLAEVAGASNPVAIHDETGEQSGHIPYVPEFYAALGTQAVRTLSALLRSPFKVIVLDCDNTLWGGVCGEDGPKGVRIDAPFQALQRFVKAQSANGMVLALCSKNEAHDVDAVFAQRDDMLLRAGDFAASRINWSPKSQNLREIARELNLGSDSLIFVDDNPAECAEVSANAPEVQVLQLPENVDEIPDFLEHAWAFDRLQVTDEDRRRAQSYAEANQRKALEQSTASFSDFIAALDLKLDIHTATDAEFPRVAQLTERTNQFNASTRRRSVADVTRLRDDADTDVYAVRVADRFGDYGLVGVVIAHRQPAHVEVDTFLLSCRVLGRGVEHRILAHLGERAVAAGRGSLRLVVIPTDRNRPMRDFMQRIALNWGRPEGDGVTYEIPSLDAAAIRFDASAPAEPVEEESSASGKKAKAVDFELRRALRKIATQRLSSADVHRLSVQRSAPTQRSGFVAPSSAAEKLLADLWREFLGVDPIGINDNFFDLGGDSVTAVQIISRAAQRGLRLSLKQHMDLPTVANLAAAASPETAPKSPAASSAQRFGLARLGRTDVKSVLAKLKESSGQ